MQRKIFIEYDGKYPCLCMGHLKVTIDNELWDFGQYCLSSGGVCIYNEDDSIVEYGPYSVNEWPEGFPEDLKEETLEKINSEIPWGCCGGCL